LWLNQAYLKVGRIFRYTHNGRRSKVIIGNLKTFDFQSARAKAIGYAEIYKDTSDVIGKLKADEEGHGKH